MSLRHVALLLFFSSKAIQEGTLDPFLSLNLTSSVDVLSGKAVCSNSTVEFTCTASEFMLLLWEKRNSDATNPVEIEDLTVRDVPQAPVKRSHGPFTVFLDSGSTSASADGLVFRNVTSRLVTTLDQGFRNGDEIRCSNGFIVVQSLTLNYSRLMGPPKPADFSTTLYSVNESPNSNVNITFMWDMDFNSRNLIEFYITTAATFSDKVLCPMFCPFNSPCVCVTSGQLPNRGVNINISAVNCNNQEGPSTTITVLPRDCQNETVGKLSYQTDSMCDNDSIGSIDIPNGVACFNGTVSGSLLSYQCATGYALVGSVNQVCLSHGDWSGEIPACRSVVYGWMIALETITLLVWILSSILIVIWSFLYYKLNAWSRLAYKVSTFTGVLTVSIILQLTVIIIWSLFVDSTRPQKSPFVGSRVSLAIVSTVLAFVALIWIAVVCLSSFVYSYRSDPDNKIKIERENELYYLGRSITFADQEDTKKEYLKKAVNVDEDDEDRIYDVISQNSENMAEEILDDSFTDSEGYIRTTQQQLNRAMGIMDQNGEDSYYV